MTLRRPLFGLLILSSVCMGQVFITIATYPPGLTTIVDGVSGPAPRTFQWIPGSTHTIAVPVLQFANANTRFSFWNWSQGGAASQTIVTPAVATAYTASYYTQHLLRIAVSPGGTASGGGWYIQGTLAGAAALPRAGYRFSGFSGALSGSGNPQFLIMDTPKTVAASFVAAPTPPREVWLRPTAGVGPGTGTQADPYDASTDVKFDALMRGFPDGTRINLLPGVFSTAGSSDNPCPSGGWLVKPGWHIRGAGLFLTTLRLSGLCVAPVPDGQGVLRGYGINVVETPYYRDAAGAIVSDLTVDANYPGIGNQVIQRRSGLGAVNLRGNHTSIRNVRAINTYGWFTDPSLPGFFNLVEVFSLSISNYFSFANGRWEDVTGAIVSDSLVQQTGGNYVNGIVINTGDGLTGGGFVHRNFIRDVSGPACVGGRGHGLMFDVNVAFNCNRSFYADSGRIRNYILSRNVFVGGRNGAIMFDAALNANFENVAVRENTLGVTNELGGTWTVLLKQQGNHPLRNFLFNNNNFVFTNTGMPWQPSAFVVHGNTPGPENIWMIDNRFDPVYQGRGTNCPIDLPLCQPGAQVTFFGSGNVTFAGQPVAQFNRNIP